MGKKYDLGVGQMVLSGLFDPGFMYCGMPENESRYKIDISGGYKAFSAYYPVGLEEIVIYDRKFRVEHVSPERIVLEQLGRV